MPYVITQSVAVCLISIVVLWCAVLCHAVLCCAAPCCAVSSEDHAHLRQPSRRVWSTNPRRLLYPHPSKVLGSSRSSTADSRLSMPLTKLSVHCTHRTLAQTAPASCCWLGLFSLSMREKRNAPVTSGTTPVVKYDSSAASPSVLSLHVLIDTDLLLQQGSHRGSFYITA